MIFEFLKNNNIEYERVDHPAVFTCEEADKVDVSLPGAKTKNLFLKDDKGVRHFIVAVSHEKKVDLKALKKLLGTSGLGFASPERMQQYLELTPGSVTLLGVINDKSNAVEVIIDEALWQAPALQCHPLINTSTVSISREALQKFFHLTNHPPQILVVPAK